MNLDIEAYKNMTHNQHKVYLDMRRGKSRYERIVHGSWINKNKHWWYEYRQWKKEHNLNF